MSEENEQTKVLKEILKWIKVSNVKEVKGILEEQLSDDSRKLVYQLSDGAKGTQEIAKMIGKMSHGTVFNYWKAWEKVGLGESISVGGGTRFKRSFDMSDFGIKIPELLKQASSQTETEESKGNNNDK